MSTMIRGKDFFKLLLPFVFTMVLILTGHRSSVAQVKDTLIADGTEGDVMKVSDSASPKKDKKSWNTFDFGFTTFKIGGGFLVDYIAYAQDE
ncbi:MAG TPA: hypothetical protein VLC28_13465, partial [Flavitalea sp.]|nr:hypothetical protein [Flavitalea sp.]